MNSFSISGNVTSTIGVKRNSGTITQTINLSGSNTISKDVNVTSSYSQVNLSELSDFRYGWFYNGNDTTNSGSIYIASDLAGTKVISILQVGDSLILPYSGSLSIYAKTSNPTTASLLQLIVTEG